MKLSEIKRLFVQQPSKIAGIGNFASRPISRGTNVGVAFEIIGETGNLDTDISRTKLGQYTNHSLTPNLKVVKSGNIYHFISIADIQPGQELTVNYKSFDFDGKRNF